MMKVIIKYIPLVFHQSKRIILQRYYEFYMFYYEPTKRKALAVNKLILKNQQQTKFTLSSMLRRIKLKNKTRNRQTNVMIEKIKAYHNNIGNLL